MRILWPLLALLPACTGDWYYDVREDTAGIFLGVWAPRWDTVFLAGGQADAGLAWVGSAEAWTALPLPGGTPLLTSVHGTASNDVWFGGLDGTLLHWDGQAFGRADWDGAEDVLAVHAASPGDVYAAGGASAFGEDAAFLWRGTPEGWAAVELPGAPPAALRAFAGVGDTIWLGGTDGALFAGRQTAWSAVPSEGAITGLSAASDGILAVTADGRLLRGDTAGLTAVSQAPRGLAAVRDFGGLALVCGQDGYLATWDLADDALIVAEGDFVDDFRAVDGLTAGAAYAVGGTALSTSGVMRGHIAVGQSPRP